MSPRVTRGKRRGKPVARSAEQRRAQERRVPAVLQSGLYAIPAIIGAALTVVAIRAEVFGLVAAVAAAAVCFVIRMVGVRYSLNAPGPPRRAQ